MNYFKDYKMGNAQQRLELFMQYPDLRSDFDQIENDENSLITKEFKQIVIKTGKIDNQHSFVVRMKRWCFSFLT